MTVTVTVVDFTAPKHVTALGVPESMTLDIVLRRALLDGHTSTMQLATGLAVTPLSDGDGGRAPAPGEPAGGHRP